MLGLIIAKGRSLGGTWIKWRRHSIGTIQITFNPIGEHISLLKGGAPWITQVSFKILYFERSQNLSHTIKFNSLIKGDLFLLLQWELQDQLVRLQIHPKSLINSRLVSSLKWIQLNRMTNCHRYDKLMQIVSQKISTWSSPVSIKHPKERTFRPIITFLNWRFHDIEYDRYSIFVIVSYDSLVCVCSIRPNNAIPTRWTLRRFVIGESYILCQLFLCISTE